MANKEVSNEDYQIQITSNGAWIPASPSVINFTIIKAQKAKANNKFILVNQITWMVPSGCVLAGYNFVSGSSSSPIQATSTKCKCDNQFVLRKDDSGICNGLFTQIIFGTPLSCSCNFKIQDAGQTKVKSE